MYSCEVHAFEIFETEFQLEFRFFYCQRKKSVELFCVNHEMH